jgi:hypothetical protein
MPRPFVLEECYGVLERTPGVLRALLAGAPEQLLQTTEGDGTFTPLDVVCHLLQADRTGWLRRIRIILLHGEAQPFGLFDGIGFRPGQPWQLPRLLEGFEATRAANLRVVRGLRLGADDLERAGTDPAFGRVTLGELLASWAVHDVGHVAQVCHLIAGRYRAQAGPWAASLPILARTEPG